MKIGKLESGMSQIPLPLGARVIDTGGNNIEYNKKNGLYRIIVPKNTTLQGADIKFVIEEESNGYKAKEYILDDYKKILPNIGPEIDSSWTIEQKAGIIKNRVRENSYYGFDTEFDKALSIDIDSKGLKLKDNPTEYCQKLFDEGTKRYEGKMMMICNQSALFATLLLKKHGIPGRASLGMPGNEKISGIGHARTEYRDGEKRQKLDATPTKTPPEHLAQEMYETQKKLKQKIEEKVITNQKNQIDKITGDFDSLPDNIKDKVDLENITDLDFTNIQISAEQLKYVIDMISLNRKATKVRNLYLSGASIEKFPDNIRKLKKLERLDISSTAIGPGGYSSIENMNDLNSVFVSEDWYSNQYIPRKIKDILHQTFIIKG